MSIAQKKLSLHLTPEQSKKLQPMLDDAGKVDVVASIQGDELKCSLTGCANSAFTPDLRLS